MTKVFDTSKKADANIWYRNLCLQLQSSRFPVVLDQVCTHCRRDFDPLLHTDRLQILPVSGRSLGNTNFQLPPSLSIGFRSGNWLGH